MSTREFTLPDLGEGLTEAEIMRWMVKAGDHVKVDQPVVEVETAKAIVEVPVPFSGVVTALNVAEGDVVEVGTVLITVADETPEANRYIEEERAGSGNVLVGYGTTKTKKRRRRPRSAPPNRADTKPTKPRTMSPVVRKLARDNGVDLTALTGSGPDGLITRADVEKAINPPAPPAAPAESLPLPVRARIPLRGARRAAAEAFTRSRREIPEATTWVDVDVTDLLELRHEINAVSPVGGRPPTPPARLGGGSAADQGARNESAPVSILALFARFVTAALNRHPELNSRVLDDEIVQFEGVHLGIAMQTDHGLVAPAVRDAHNLSARGLQAEMTRLTEAARAGSLALSDLTSGTFTLNNYGVFGVDGSAPIINHPQTAMLGIGRILDRPWAVDGSLEVRKIAQLSLVFDHRVCDGAPAAAFLRFVADCAEHPRASLADI